MVEQIARYKPSDKISITYNRGGKESTVNVTLKNKLNTFKQIKKKFKPYFKMNYLLSFNPNKICKKILKF